MATSSVRSRKYTEKKCDPPDDSDQRNIVGKEPAEVPIITNEPTMKKIKSIEDVWTEMFFCLLFFWNVCLLEHFYFKLKWNGFMHNVDPCMEIKVGTLARPKKG